MLMQVRFGQVRLGKVTLENLKNSQKFREKPKKSLTNVKRGKIQKTAERLKKL